MVFERFMQSANRLAITLIRLDGYTGVSEFQFYSIGSADTLSHFQSSCQASFKKPRFLLALGYTILDLKRQSVKDVQKTKSEKVHCTLPRAARREGCCTSVFIKFLPGFFQEAAFSLLE